ncbi:hypothetical protein QAD02_000449 [Eretmocerus hayati]|uniref:Uncharacterized protein n=1 Tax=Eretmocerus hayati TaxID=131215 RepID=A0ACC2NDF9_9HYME|nr:hypothetical protein QAD02_000449 [Eretmocerus hayati]
MVRVEHVDILDNNVNLMQAIDRDHNLFDPGEQDLEAGPEELIPVMDLEQFEINDDDSMQMLANQVRQSTEHGEQAARNVGDVPQRMIPVVDLSDFDDDDVPIEIIPEAGRIMPSDDPEILLGGVPPEAANALVHEGPIAAASSMEGTSLDQYTPIPQKLSRVSIVLKTLNEKTSETAIELIIREAY